MKVHRRFQLMFAAFALFVAAATSSEPLGTAFSYQGELRAAGQPANGTYDFTFDIYDLASGGSTIAAQVALDDVSVQNGIFSVELDFGILPFSGDRLWLEVGVRDGASADAFTMLDPRQEVLPAPYALHAQFVALGSVGGDEIVDAEVQRRIDGSCTVGSFIAAVNADGSVSCAADQGLTSITSGDIVDGTIVAADTDSNSLQQRVTGTCSAGSFVTAVGTDGSVNCSPDQGLTSVTSGDIVDGSIVAADTDSSSVQQRVTGTCSLGNYISGVGADGSVTCAIDQGLTSVNSGNIVDGSIIAADTDSTSVQRRVSGSCGLGYYMYGIAEDGSVMCDFAGRDASVDPAASGDFIDMLVRPDGTPLIATAPLNGGGVNIVDCLNAACSLASIHTPGSTSGNGVGIDFNSAGTPVVGGRGSAGKRLSTLSCADATCSSAATTSTSADFTLADYAFGVSMRVRRASADRPIYFYYSLTPNHIMFAYDCFDSGCTTGMERILFDSGPSFVPGNTNSVIRSGGLPFVAATNGTSVVAFDCTISDCSAGNLRTLDTISPRFQIGLALFPDGRPVIVYDKYNNLTAYICADAGCSSGSSHILVSVSTYLRTATVTITPDGLPLIAYRINGEGELMVVSCSAADCSTVNPPKPLRSVDSGATNYGSSARFNGNGTPTVVISQNPGSLAIHSCGKSDCSD